MNESRFLAGAILAISFVIPVFVYRVVRGPSVFDRLIGLNGISTKAVLLLVLVGAYDRQLDMFLDIALGYGLLNLVGALAVGKYLERREVKA